MFREILGEIACGTSTACMRCKTVGKGKPLLLEPIEENPVVMLISQAPGQSIDFKEVRSWLFEGFIPRLFDKIDRKFDCVESHPYWKCSAAYWTHLGKCFPGSPIGGHLPPPKHCAETFLWRELKAVGPKLVIGLGCAVWAFQGTHSGTDR